MSAFFEYIRNITYYLLFATLIGMAAPSGKYKKYVSLVTGLVLVLLIIKPLQAVAGQGVPVTEWFTGATTTAFASGEQAMEPSEYERWSNGQIRAAFEEQLYAQVENLLASEGYTLTAARFEYKEDFSELTSMDLTVEAGKERVPLIRIDPVIIGSKAADGNPEDATTARIKKIIADFYAPSAPHINVKTD